MKISAVILSLLMPAVTVAQNYPGMSEADMRKIQEMQSCMEKVDQNQFKTIERRQYQFEAEVKSLCDNGKRDEAQKKAILFAKEIAKNPAIVAMSKCGEIAKDIMPDMPFMDLEDDASGPHVCDSI